MGDVVAGGFDVLQVPLAAVAEVGFLTQEEFSEAGHRREGVVDVMGDAAGQLPDGAQPFVLHDGALRPANFVVRALQLRVQPRLMRRQSDMLTERPQKLAFADAESVGSGAGGNEDAEEFFLDHHGHDDG